MNTNKMSFASGEGLPKTMRISLGNVPKEKRTQEANRRASIKAHQPLVDAYLRAQYPKAGF